jgi:hypothetical protein
MDLMENYNWCPKCRVEPEPDCQDCDAIRAALKRGAEMAIADLKTMEEKRTKLADREAKIYYGTD